MRVQFGNVHFLLSAEVLSIFPIVTPIGKSPNKYERPHEARPFFAVNLRTLIYCGLFRNYIRRAGPFFALAHCVLNLLPLVKVRIPGGLDF